MALHLYATFVFDLWQVRWMSHSSSSTALQWCNKLDLEEHRLCTAHERAPSP